MLIRVRRKDRTSGPDPSIGAEDSPASLTSNGDESEVGSEEANAAIRDPSPIVLLLLADIISTSEQATDDDDRA